MCSVTCSSGWLRTWSTASSSPGVHGWARRLLLERGIRINVDESKARAAFDAAWRSLPGDGPLHRSRCDADYWREEISKVIKGRGITAFETYADLPRTGRRYRLTIEQRREVWDLYERYQRELSGRSIHDFDDLILLALAELAARAACRARTRR